MSNPCDYPCDYRGVYPCEHPCAYRGEHACKHRGEWGRARGGQANGPRRVTWGRWCVCVGGGTTKH